MVHYLPHLKLWVRKSHHVCFLGKMLKVVVELLLSLQGLRSLVYYINVNLKIYLLVEGLFDLTHISKGMCLFAHIKLSSLFILPHRYGFNPHLSTEFPCLSCNGNHIYSDSLEYIEQSALLGLFKFIKEFGVFVIMVLKVGRFPCNPTFNNSLICS